MSGVARLWSRPTSAQPPRVSVILAVHDAAPFLREALEAISGQTFSDFEVIAVDDGSTDGSREQLLAHARDDARFRVICQDNRGGAAARSMAIEQARASLLAIADADDVAAPDRLRLQVERFCHDPDLTVLGGAADLIDEHGVLIGHDDVPAGSERIAEHLLTVGSCLYDPTVMMRREAFLAVGGYRAKLSVGYDYDLWLRLLPRRLDNLHDTLVRYRLHERQATSQGRMLVELSQVVLRASRQAVAEGWPDPVDVWDGGLSLGLLPDLHLTPGAEFGLYARLLDAAAAGQSDREQGQLSIQEVEAQAWRRSRALRLVDDVGDVQMAMGVARRWRDRGDPWRAAVITGRLWRTHPIEVPVHALAAVFRRVRSGVRGRLRSALQRRRRA